MGWIVVVVVVIVILAIACPQAVGGIAEAIGDLFDD